MKQFYAAFALVLALITSVLSTRAQASFQPGYIVSLTGDTTHGAVARQNGPRSAVSCRFRSGTGSETPTYSPAQLRAYGSTDTAYGAFSYEARPVTTGGRPPEPLFLAVLVDGPVSLYLLVEPGTERYFIDEPAVPGPLVELRREVLERPELGSNVRQTKNYYHDDLERAFRACPAVQRQVRQTSFNQSALQRLVERYNACQAPAGAAVAPTQSSVRLTLSAVLCLPAYHRFRTGEGQGRAASDAEFAGGYYLCGGLVASITNAYQGTHFQVITGIMAEVNRAYAAQQSYSIPAYYAPYIESQVQASFSYLKLPVLLRYRWQGAWVRPYAEAGGYVRYLLATPHNNVTDTYTTSSLFLLRSYELFSRSSVLTLAPAVGAGLQLGRPGRRGATLGVQAEWAVGPELANAPQNYSTTSLLFSVNALVAYDLHK